MAEEPLPAHSAGVLSRAEEEASFYHEAALNASWTGARLGIGSLTFAFGAFVFAFFYLKSLNSHDMWYPTATLKPPQAWAGALVMALVVASAAIQTGVLQLIKAGGKAAWLAGAVLALVLGLAAIGVEVWQLLNLPFQPGAAGFASVFTGFYPVFIVIAFAVMVWLEMLIMRCRPVPAISFVEQPPTYAEAFAVQRFQSSLSAFTLIWNFMAVVTLFFFLLFYVL